MGLEHSEGEEQDLQDALGSRAAQQPWEVMKAGGEWDVPGHVRTETLTLSEVGSKREC